MAEPKHDVDYADPEEEKKVPTVSPPFLMIVRVNSQKCKRSQVKSKKNAFSSRDASSTDSETSNGKREAQETAN